MPRSPFLFIALLVLGLTAAAAFRSTGALTAADALVAAAAQGASVLDPPLRLTTRATSTMVSMARSVEPTLALFPLVHVLPGILMALVAACSGTIAFRTARGHDAARAAAGIAVGAACLFGADLGAAGRAAGAVPMVLALLSSAALLWIAPRPAAFAGGLLVGLAAVEQPLVLLVLPGFLMIALGAAIRGEPSDDSRILRRAALGFAVGCGALLLPGSEARGAPLLRFSSPTAWIPAIVELAKILWRATGPIGFPLAVWGAFSFFRGEARHARPFLLVLAIPALASILFVPSDPAMLGALIAWPFLLFMVPGFCEAARWTAARLPARHAAPALAGLAAIASVALFAMNRAAIDRRAERGIDWARDSFARLTENAVLLTENPVHWALVADGERPDLDVILVDHLETVRMRRSTLGIFAPEWKEAERDKTGYLRQLIAMNLPHRPIFLDPTVFFDLRRRTEILGEEWQTSPFGLAFRIAPVGTLPPEVESKAAAILWDGYETQPGTPPSELRGGLGGNEYYARSLLQSAALNLDLRLRRDAEREFLFALTLDAANPNPALYGLGRIAIERQSFEEAVNTIEPRVRRDRPGAWAALQVLGNAYLRLGDLEGAKRALREALELAPPSLTAERESIQNMLRGAEQGKRLPGRGPAPTSVPDRER